nr:hypothetical protein [Alteraurantiacibacter aestuarii]
MTIIGSVLRSRHNALNGYATDQQGNPVGPSPREREMAAELTELRERVKVLERIATDGNETVRLSAEIDRLRDE